MPTLEITYTYPALMFASRASTAAMAASTSASFASGSARLPDSLCSPEERSRATASKILLAFLGQLRWSLPLEGIATISLRRLDGPCQRIPLAR